MICLQPSLSLAHMGCSHGRVHDCTRGSPHRCPGGRHPHRSSPGKRPGDGGRRRPQEGACIMHAEINCLLNAGRKLSSYRRMTMYSTLIPRNMCAGAIVHFGIIKIVHFGIIKMVYGESRNLPEDNGRELLVRYGVELANLTSRRPGGYSEPSLRQSRKSGRPT